MEIAAKLRKLNAAALSDALGKTGAMDHQIQCRTAAAFMAGPAFTARVHPADILMVGKALSLCPRGHVLVVDGQGEANTALWGELMTMAAARKRLAGVVIDGAVRDRAILRKSRFPVYARSVVPNAGGAEYPGETGVTVQCGGVVVSPGDWVVGDADGVVVIPRSRIEEAISGAERIVKAERGIARAIRAGEDIAAILRCDETLARKAAADFLPQLRARQGRNRAGSRR